MATQAQWDKAIAAGFTPAELQVWTDGQWNYMYPPAETRMQQAAIVEPVMVKIDEEAEVQEARAENWESRKAPVFNAEMQQAIDARLDAEWEDDDISLDLGIKQELINEARRRRDELRQFADTPRTVHGDIPLASHAWKKAEEALEQEEEEGDTFTMMQLPGGMPWVLPGIIEMIYNAVDLDSIPTTDWGKIWKSLKPRRILTEEDYLAQNDFKREALKIAYEQFEYEGVDPEDWTPERTEHRMKLIMGSKIPPVRNAKDAVNGQMSEDEIKEMFEDAPNTFTTAFMDSLEWGTQTRRPGQGVTESGLMYAARLAQAPISAVVGGVEAAFTDKDLADAVSERIEGGLGVMGGGHDAGAAFGAELDGAAEWLGIDTGADEKKGIPGTFQTAGGYVGGTIGLAIDLYIPLDLGALGTIGSVARKGTTAFKVSSALGGTTQVAARAAVSEGARAIGTAARSGASRVVGGATLPGRVVIEGTKSTKATAQTAKRWAKKKLGKKLTSDEAAAAARAEEAAGAQVDAMWKGEWGDLLMPPRLVTNILKDTKIQKLIKGQGEISIVTRVAQKFAAQPTNIQNAKKVYNFKTDYLQNRKIVEGVTETPEQFFARTQEGVSWEDFVKVAEQGGFKVQSPIDYATFNKQAMEAMWIASLDDVLSLETKSDILARGMAGTDDLVNDIIKNWDALGENEASFLHVLNRMADEALENGLSNHWTVQIRNAVQPSLSGTYAKPIIPKLDDTLAAEKIASAYAGKGVSDLVNELQATGRLGIQEQVKIGGRFLDEAQQREIIALVNKSEMHKVMQEIAANPERTIVGPDGQLMIVLTREQMVRILNDLEPRTSGLTPTGDETLDLFVSGSKDFNRVMRDIQKGVDEGIDEFALGLAEWNQMASSKVESLAAAKFGSRTVEDVAADIRKASPKQRAQYANRVLAPKAIRNNLIGEKVEQVVAKFNDSVASKLSGDPIAGEVVENIASRLGALSENNASTLTRYRAEGLTPTQAGAKLIVQDAFSSNPELLLREYTNLILGGHERIIRKPLTKGKAKVDISPEDIDQLTSVILSSEKGKAHLEKIKMAISHGDDIGALILLDDWHRMMEGQSVEKVFGVKAELNNIFETLQQAAKVEQAIDPLTVSPVTKRLIEAADTMSPIYRQKDATELVHIVTLQQQKANIINDVMSNAAKKYPQIFPNRKVIDDQSTIWFENVLLRNKVQKWMGGSPPPRGGGSRPLEGGEVVPLYPDDIPPSSAPVEGFKGQKPSESWTKMEPEWTEPVGTSVYATAKKLREYDLWQKYADVGLTEREVQEIVTALEARLDKAYSEGITIEPDLILRHKDDVVKQFLDKKFPKDPYEQGVTNIQEGPISTAEAKISELTTERGEEMMKAIAARSRAKKMAEGQLRDELNRFLNSKAVDEDMFTFSGLIVNKNYNIGKAAHTAAAPKPLPFTPRATEPLPPRDPSLLPPPGKRYVGGEGGGGMPFEKVSGEPIEEALLELTRRLRHKLWVDDAVDNMMNMKGVGEVKAFDRMMNSSVKKLLSLDEAQIAKLSDVPIEGGSLSPQEIVRQLQANPTHSKAVLKWMLGETGSLKPAWRPGRAYAESLNPTIITKAQTNRIEALLRAAIAQPKPGMGAAQQIAEAISIDAAITSQIRRMTERTGIQGVDETLTRIRLKESRQMNDINPLTPEETNAALRMLEWFSEQRGTPKLYYSGYDQNLGQQLFNSFWTGAGYTNNVMKSGMLAGTTLPAVRYMMNNFSTAPSIMYSTIGSMGLEGAGNLTRGARVVAFSNPIYVGTGKASATEILAVAPSGKAYTTEMLAEIMRTNGLSRSQASAELTSNVAKDFMRETDIDFQRFLKTLPESEHRAARAWMQRNITAWKGTNIWGKFANETDNAFRSGVLIAGIENGLPLEQAIKLSRESLFDYSKSIKGLHRWVWFLTFRQNNWKTFAKNAVTNPNRLKNIMLTTRGIPEDDIQGKWRAHIAPTEWAATRMYFNSKQDKETNQRVGYYSPPIPQMEAAQDFANILQAHGESILISSGDIPVTDPTNQLMKAYVRAAGENVNPWINLAASQAFGIDIRRGPDRQVTNLVDGWLLFRLQQQPETWEWFKNEFNVKAVPKNKEYPGGSTFQGRQWAIDKNDEAARKRWNRWKFSMMMTGQERGLREWLPIGSKVIGEVEERRAEGDVVEMKYDPSWAQSLGITTPIQEPTIEEVERMNRRKTYYDIRP